MQTNRVDSLLVVDGPKFLGTVRIWEIQQNFKVENLTLKDIMVTGTQRIEQGQSLAEAIELMSKHDVAYLPVVTADNNLLGVVTRGSLVDVMAHRYENNETPGGES